MLGVGSRVKHPEFGDGVIVRLHAVAYEVCFIETGIRTIGKTYTNWEVTEEIPVEESITFTEAEKSLTRILRAWAGFSLEVAPLGERWKDGLMILKPDDDSLKPKEIPIESFFHKIVMMRDKLRVLEQNINSQKNLSDEEKVNLQQYITRCYGSMTTFNVLFKEKEDYFSGSPK